MQTHYIATIPHKLKEYLEYENKRENTEILLKQRDQKINQFKMSKKLNKVEYFEKLKEHRQNVLGIV